MNLNGLAKIHIELSSECNKNCWCCGRRKLDKLSSNKQNYGHMSISTAKKIASQLPPNIICAFHWNGESLMNPNFGEIVNLFNKQIKCMNTNGKLLVEKADQIIDNLDTLTISVIQDDKESKNQIETVEEFLQMKGSKKPFTIYRLLGNVENVKRWEELPGMVVTRILHDPMGSYDYTKNVTKPETGICADFLNTLAIDRNGNVSFCVRFDPEKTGVIGNINETSLESIWNSEKRMQYLQYHKKGKRNMIELCSKCDFWGIPRGA
jgi:radical SAM protein with 4Fe4S-binding SPASM domain